MPCDQTAPLAREAIGPAPQSRRTGSPLPDEDLPSVATAAHEVVLEAKDADVWIFVGEWKARGESGGHPRDGQRPPVPGDQGGPRRVCNR